MKKIIIAIDGFSSCGKSTLAKQLAAKLNYVFIDTGAMYRAITLYFLRNNINTNNSTEIENALQQIHLSFEYNKIKESSDIYLNAENVEAEIRNKEVTQNVSRISTLKEVRTFGVVQQQKMGDKKGVVMDGRDIGTVVFPNAELKIFVTANIEIRVERRFKEMMEKNIDITRNEIKKNLEERDFIDSTREIGPLKKATDALELDNSHITREEQLAIALNWANEKINAST
jgi:cytidylate kinase